MNSLTSILPRPHVLVPPAAYQARDEVYAQVHAAGITHEAKEVLLLLVDQIFEMYFYLALVEDIYAEAETVSAAANSR